MDWWGGGDAIFLLPLADDIFSHSALQTAGPSDNPGLLFWDCSLRRGDSELFQGDGLRHFRATSDLSGGQEATGDFRRSRSTGGLGGAAGPTAYVHLYAA
jgi:hypothetical protein